MRLSCGVLWGSSANQNYGRGEDRTGSPVPRRRDSVSVRLLSAAA